MPLLDLTDRLNELAGPKMTCTDVQQRLNALLEVSYFPYPDERLHAGCLEFYETEKAKGTEFTAIVYALRDYVDEEEGCLRREWQNELSRRNEEENWRRESDFVRAPTVSGPRWRMARRAFMRARTGAFSG